MIVNDKPRHYTGLSTDTKPNLGWRGNGYAFLESDTGREYVYSAKVGAWLPLAESVDAPCVGILKIEKTSSEGSIDTYTIYYTNGSTTTFDVTNGGESSVIANPTLSGDEATLNGLEVDGTKYKVGSGSGVETLSISISNWGTVNNPVTTNLTQEQIEKLNNGAFVKVIDENAEYEPTMFYPFSESTEENLISYFTASIHTESSVRRSLIDRVVIVDVLNGVLIAIAISEQLDAAKMGAITDTSGNSRFDEGDGTPATISGITSTYCKWSLSGTHLMIVYAGTLSGSTSLPKRTIASFELPEWILNKILPLNSDGLVSVINGVFAYEGNFTYKQQKLIKTVNGLEIANATEGIVASNSSGFRIQFDLLIDAK